jgi:ubiquinone/menaquinone biosynthesis C-methylase UbiE
MAFRLLRLAFHLFYNPCAFTYDFVSALVSRGRWRDWTRAAIPRLTGTRVLEVPCGTGNLLLDLCAAGYAPIGVDLSASMLNITRRKFGRNSVRPRLARARAQALPFPDGAFDSVVMTFPPGFVYDSSAFGELRRVLDERGRLIWVDGARFTSGVWGRLVNRWTGYGGGEIEFERTIKQVLARAGFDAQVKWVEDDASIVAVAVATKAVGSRQTGSTGDGRLRTGYCL